MKLELLAVVSPDDLRRPDAICDRCGRKGTMAQSHRRDIPEAPMRRFCAECWPEERADQIRLEIEEGALHSSAWLDPRPTWDALIALVDAVERIVPSEDAVDPRHRWVRRGTLMAMAGHIASTAERIDGPMPQVVREFIARHPRPQP